MYKNLLIVSIAGLSFVLPALASDRSDDVGRIQKATQVFQEIMRTPDQGIPQELLETAKCVAIIPGEEKAAFIFGGSYGKGLATCRTAHGWSAPMFLAVGGGSVGFLLGRVEVAPALRTGLGAQPVGEATRRTFPQRLGARGTEPGVGLGLGSALTAHTHGETLSSAAPFVDRR